MILSPEKVLLKLVRYFSRDRSYKSGKNNNKPKHFKIHTLYD